MVGGGDDGGGGGVVDPNTFGFTRSPNARPTLVSQFQEAGTVEMKKCRGPKRGPKNDVIRDRICVIR